jgi:hypothetical protein
MVSSTTIHDDHRALQCLQPFSLSFRADYQAIAVAFRLPVTPNPPLGLNRRARHPVVLRLLRFLRDSDPANFFDPLNSDGAIAVYA